MAVDMLNALTLLVVCQFIGEVTARFLNLPLPGPVIGNWLLRHFGLLFVPAGVGVINQLDALRENWLALLVAIPVSTFAGLVTTAWVMQRLSDSDDEG